MSPSPDNPKVRVLVIDDTGKVSQRLDHLLAQMGVDLTTLRSDSDIVKAVSGAGSNDLLIINVTSELQARELARGLRRARFAGRTLAIVDVEDLMDSTTEELARISRSQSVIRPRSLDLLDELVRNTTVNRLLPPVPPSASTDSPSPFCGMVGTSPPMLEIFSRIDKFARTDANICIYGESGTGKELIARAIHSRSARPDGPLVTLDCTTIPAGLIESQLFGHVRGAFTGAIDYREGVFSLAHMGTLFIDELDELSMTLQAKLLRVIQTREFFRVGGTKSIHTNIRLITAMNRDPRGAVEDGTFREDLYYRVAVVTLRMPPLRERKEDIPLLAEHFLRKFATIHRKPARAIAPAAIKRMMMFPWPGNVRQLENFVEQAVVLTDSDTLTERDIFVEDPSLPSYASAQPVEPGLSLRELERHYIMHTLAMLEGNRSETARRLGISVRGLQYKLKAYSADRHATLSSTEFVHEQKHQSDEP